MTNPPHLLIVQSPYYKDIAAELYRGARLALEAAGATHDLISVPGVLEIPAAISMAQDVEIDGLVLFDDDIEKAGIYHGYIALGCVIRGETTHYEIVSNQSARALMDMSVQFSMAMGNGIQTVENEQQAWARANVDDKNKGGGAAEAALAMIAVREQLRNFNV